MPRNYTVLLQLVSEIYIFARIMSLLIPDSTAVKGRIF